MQFVHRKPRQEMEARTGMDHARMVPERSREPVLLHHLPHRERHRAVGVGEELRSGAELLLQTARRPLDVAVVVLAPERRHLVVGRRLVADGRPAAHHLADLLPAHVVLSTLVDRIGGDEQGDRQLRLPQPRPGLGVEGQKRAVDGKRDRAVGQAAPGLERRQDFGQRHHVEAPFRDHLQMGLELIDADRRGRRAGVAESLIHEDHGGGLGGGARQAAPARQNGQPRERAAHRPSQQPAPAPRHRKACHPSPHPSEVARFEALRQA